MSTYAVRRRRQVAEDRRVSAAGLFAAGVAQAEVARRLGVSPQAVTRWHQHWREQGVEGLRARSPGPKTRLTEAQRVELARLLQAPVPSGSPEWTLRRIVQVIASRFGVAYAQPDGVWKLLHRMGFTLQQPARRAVERDEEAIAEFRARQWVQIVKKPGPAGRGSSSSTSQVSA